MTGVKNGAAFIDNLKLFYHASNLADSHSLVTHPASTTHSQMSPEDQIAAGVLPEMIRVSVGLEDPLDLMDEIDRALEIALKV